MASQMTPRTTLLHHTTVGTLAPGIRPWLQMETPRTTLLHRMTKGALAAGIRPWLQRERRILSKPTLAVADWSSSCETIDRFLKK